MPETDVRIGPLEKVVRYCRKRTIPFGQDRAGPGAFILNKDDNGFLSVNWLGKYSSVSELEQAKKCQQDYYKKLVALGVQLSEGQKKAARFAVIPVGKTEMALQAEMQLALEIWGFQYEHDPSYAGIFKLPEESLEAAELILSQTEIHYSGNL